VSTYNTARYIVVHIMHIPIQHTMSAVSWEQSNWNCRERGKKVLKVKKHIAVKWNSISQLRDVTCHMGSHKCYLPPDTSERAPPSPQPVSRYSIYLPRRDGRLSWPRLPGNAPAGNRTRDLSITSPTPYHYTNRATQVHVSVGMHQIMLIILQLVFRYG